MNSDELPIEVTQQSESSENPEYIPASQKSNFDEISQDTVMIAESIDRELPTQTFDNPKSQLEISKNQKDTLKKITVEKGGSRKIKEITKIQETINNINGRFMRIRRDGDRNALDQGKIVQIELLGVKIPPRNQPGSKMLKPISRFLSDLKTAVDTRKSTLQTDISDTQRSIYGEFISDQNSIKQTLLSYKKGNLDTKKTSLLLQLLKDFGKINTPQDLLSISMDDIYRLDSIQKSQIANILVLSEPFSGDEVTKITSDIISLDKNIIKDLNLKGDKPGYPTLEELFGMNISGRGFLSQRVEVSYDIEMKGSHLKQIKGKRYCSPKLHNLLLPIIKEKRETKIDQLYANMYRADQQLETISEFNTVSVGNGNASPTLQGIDDTLDNYHLTQYPEENYRESSVYIPLFIDKPNLISIIPTGFDGFENEMTLTLNGKNIIGTYKKENGVEKVDRNLQYIDANLGAFQDDKGILHLPANVDKKLNLTFTAMTSRNNVSYQLYTPKTSKTTKIEESVEVVVYETPYAGGRLGSLDSGKRTKTPEQQAESDTSISAFISLLQTKSQEGAMLTEPIDFNVQISSARYEGDAAKAQGEIDKMDVDIASFQPQISKSARATSLLSQFQSKINSSETKNLLARTFHSDKIQITYHKKLLEARLFHNLVSIGDKFDSTFSDGSNLTNLLTSSGKPIFELNFAVSNPGEKVHTTSVLRFEKDVITKKETTHTERKR
ncbi:hypothetical protein AGMMS50249_4960 [candidate division SR1 bacterium]|nr:hypothetical protein AGMMS50249_4960 [candidate division SR1 bacterium]